MKKTMMYLERGLSIGFVVTALSVLCMEGMSPAAKQLLVWMVASALYGVLSMIFERDALPLLAATAIHMVACAAVTLTAGAILGYGAGLGELAAVMLPVFVFIYALIYGGIYLSIWLGTRRMNRKLSQR